MNFKSSRNAKISNLLMKKFNLLVEQEEDIMSTADILDIVKQAETLLKSGEDGSAVNARRLQIQASQELKKGRNARSEDHINLFNQFGGGDNNFQKGVAMRAINVPVQIDKEFSVGGNTFPWTGQSKDLNRRKFQYLAVTGQLPFESWSSFEAGFEDPRGSAVLNQMGKVIGDRNRKAAKTTKAVVDTELEKRGRRGVYNAGGQLTGVERIPGDAGDDSEAWKRWTSSAEGNGVKPFFKSLGAVGSDWPSDEDLKKAASSNDPQMSNAAKKVQAAKASAVSERDRVGQYRELGINDVFSGAGALQNPDELEAFFKPRIGHYGEDWGPRFDKSSLPENEQKALERYVKRNRMRYEALQKDVNAGGYRSRETGKPLTMEQRVTIYNEKIKGQQKNENQNMANYFDNFYDQIISEQRHPSSKSQGLIDVGDYGFDKREANLPVFGDPSITNRGTAVNVINTIPINSYPHPSDFTDSGINDHKATSATQGWNRPSEVSQKGVFDAQDHDAVTDRTRNQILDYNSENNIEQIDNRRSQEEIVQFQSNDQFYDEEKWMLDQLGMFDTSKPAYDTNVEPEEEFEVEPMAPFQEALIRKVVQEALKRKFGE